MGHDPAPTLDYLKSRGCRLGGVRLGERGLLWYDDMRAVRTLPALAVPSDRVLDTNGTGDVFHGAYVYSYLTNPEKSWEEHFRFARAASAFKIQRLATRQACRPLAKSLQPGRSSKFRPDLFVLSQ
jgi:sugar/nucleoside kinase (ribokinase family)